MHTCIRVFAFAPLSSQTNVPQQILRAIETSTLRKREEVSAQTEEHPIGYARMEKYKKKKKNSHWTGLSGQSMIDHPMDKCRQVKLVSQCGSGSGSESES